MVTRLFGIRISATGSTWTPYSPPSAGSKQAVSPRCWRRRSHDKKNCFAGSRCNKTSKTKSPRTPCREPIPVQKSRSGKCRHPRSLVAGRRRIANDNVLSFTIWVGKRATNSGRLPQTATIRSLVCPREMRPVAFLDPSAFIGPESYSLICRSSTNDRDASLSLVPAGERERVRLQRQLGDVATAPDKEVGNTRLSNLLVVKNA
jgi:hypothetical protein